jgi:hypothetical protein
MTMLELPRWQSGITAVDQGWTGMEAAEPVGGRP